MVPQTDHDWLERMAAALPNELSEAEIAALRQRVIASPELRAALAEQLQMDQLLARALGPIDLSADRIIDRAECTSGRRGRSLMALFGLTVALLIVLGAGIWFARGRGRRPPVIADQVAGDQDGQPLKIDSGAEHVNGQIVQPARDGALPGDPSNGTGNAIPPTAQEAAPPIRIEVAANTFVRGNVFVEQYGGEDVIRESGADEPSWVEYEVQVPKAGEYDLQIRYMNYYSRPLAISVNGEQVRGAAAADIARSMTWSDEHEIPLSAGQNVIRFEGRRSPEVRKKQTIPRLSKFALIEDRDAAARAARSEQVKPWQEANQLGGAPRAAEQVAFEDFSPSDDGLTGSDLTRWFDVDHKFDDLSYFKSAQFHGNAKFRPAWPEDAAMRLSLSDYNAFHIQFWHGASGVDLHFYTGLRQLAAYAIEAKPAQPGAQGKILTLLGNDDDRLWRTYPLEPATYDIRCQQGQLVVSRGDVRLLSVPFAGVPDAVHFDGRAAIRQLSLIHSPGLPPVSLAERRPQLDLQSPAKMSWLGELPASAVWSPRDDGAVELKCEKSQQSAWKAFALPADGPYEMIAELDDLRPGSRIFLGNAAGQPQYVLGFPREKRSGSLATVFLSPLDNRFETELDPQNAIAPTVLRHTWIRLVFGAGTLKAWSSADGLHWNRAADPLTNLEGSIATLGIGCAASDQPQQITMRQFALRKLETIQSLAPAEVLKSAIVVRESQIDRWNERVVGQLPDGVDAAAWRRGCALRTLGAGCSKTLGNALLDSLVDDALAGALPAEKQFDLLDDVSLLYDCWGNPDGVLHLVQQYERAGERRFRGGETQPFTLVSNRLMNAPITAVNRPAPDSRILPSSLLRPEIYELVYGHQTDDLREFSQLLRFWNRDEPLLASVESRCGRALPAVSSKRHSIFKSSIRQSQASVDRRHPLIEELSKEGYNLMAEFEAAVANKSYRDACELIANLAPDEVQGLLPHATDQNLLITLSTEVESAMREHPDLRKTMCDEFGPIAALRFKQASAEGDADAIAALAVQFQSTTAASEAQLWLGDRSLSEGDALAALEHYRLADRAPSAEIKSALDAHRRLAAAWLGRDQGQPLTSSANVTLGDRRLTGAEFEQLVADLQKRTPSPLAGMAVATNARRDAAPTPSGFTAEVKAELTGEYGNSLASPLEMQYAQGAAAVQSAIQENRGLDFGGRLYTLSHADDLLLACNRCEVWAYDAKSGEKRWQSSAKYLSQQEKPWIFDWPLTGMRPLVVADRLYVRRLVRSVPQVVCLNRADGNLVWTSPPGLCMASDPVLVQNRLLVLTAAASDQIFTISLTTLDPVSGNVLARRRLFDLRRNWWTERSCQVSVLDGGLTAVCGATVFRCDPSGNLQWIRRQDWFSDGEDKTWVNQYQEPPLVRSDHIFATQPGVHCVEAMDVDTGRLAWRKVLPSIHRVCDLIDDRLIVETDDGLVALDAKTGQPAWYCDIRGLLTGQLCGGPGKMACFARQESPAAPPKLLWIDTTSGRVSSETVLTDLKYANVQIGPVVLVGDRIWGLIGKYDPAASWPAPPTRELFEFKPNGSPLLPKSSAAN